MYRSVLGLFAYYFATVQLGLFDPLLWLISIVYSYQSLLVPFLLLIPMRLIQC